MKTLVNAIDYACRLGEGPGNQNISLGSVLKLLLVSHIAVVFAALLVVAVAKSHCIIWQLLWLPELDSWKVYPETSLKPRTLNTERY